ncbi:MAG TPA: PAS domain S-box protein, partial [Solirubrobacteraceae bacterium]|nr:PAS domain S-box protein [Solirubrobacteraceae bacterium]
MAIGDPPASEALHRAVLDSALDCIVTIDGDGCIVEFNPAAERTFGWAEEEVTGRPMVEVIVPPHLRGPHREGFARYLRGGEPRILDRRVEVEAVRRDGTLFPVELAITRIALEGPMFLTGHIRDITERKEGEEELRRSRARLVEAADA